MLLLQGIPQMEPLVMEAISWAFKPTLQSVHPQEAQVLAWRESIASTITAALYPARQYISKMQAYGSWLALDPTAYVDNLTVSNFSWSLQPLSTLSAWRSWLGQHANLGHLLAVQAMLCLSHHFHKRARLLRLNICMMHGSFPTHLHATLPA